MTRDPALAPEARRLALSNALTRDAVRQLGGPIAAEGDEQPLAAAARALASGARAVEERHRIRFDPPYPGVTAGPEWIATGLRLVLACTVRDSTGVTVGTVFTTLIAGRHPRVSVAPPATPIPPKWAPLDAQDAAAALLPASSRKQSSSDIVASVYADVRTRMPFVPRLFKALAADHPALVDAWLQARALHDDARSRDAAARLRALAVPDLAYRPSPKVRAIVAPFARELPMMLLVVTSLCLTLDGVLERRAKPPLDLPPREAPPEMAAAEARAEHPLFEEIRAVYGTSDVPSIFRALAAEDLLDEPWRAIGPFVAAPEGRELVSRVGEAAEEEALRFPEVAFFTRASARRTLEQFRIALPRNLVFAAAASR